MINAMAYDAGSTAAYEKFATGVKPLIAQVTNFAKGAKPVAGPAPVKPIPGVTMGGAAAPVGAPAVTTPAAIPTPAGQPTQSGFLDGWKGQAAMQLGVPMAMMGLQSMMTPSQPKDPNTATY